MRILPAIDIINGKCVRLSKGDYATAKIYNESPLEVAKKFEDHGIRFLHLVDLDGARSLNIMNYKILEKISSETQLQVDFGGGLKNDNAIRMAFECGAKQVTLGSIAITEPSIVEVCLQRYGPDKIILGADAFDRKIATHGWSKKTETDVLEFITANQEKGISYCICTDISKDGMLQGPSIELYQEILSRTKVNLIASGGVSSLTDIKQLKQIGCEGVILGKAIYEGRITLKEIVDLC